MTDALTKPVHSRLFPAVVCLALCGCGGTYGSYVSGTITLDGEPLPRGTVAFNPTTPGVPAYSRIDDNGKYTIQTGREEGLPPGQYVVTVVVNEVPTKAGENGGPPAAGKPITPRWYRSANASPLKITVDSGSNEVNLELTSDPPPGWKPKSKGRRKRR